MSFRTGLLLLIVACLAGYCPILAGYVPFPADIVLQFPPWDGVARASFARMQHAEQGDLVTAFYPWRTALNSTLSIQKAPLWNHHVLMGTPYVAMPQSGVFFPLNWAFSVLSGPVAWSLLFLLRVVIIAVTMAIFAKRLGMSTAAALISGFTFAFCGWVVSFQSWPLLDSAMWLPLMFLTVDWLRQRPSRRSIAGGALVFALPVLGGHAEVAFQVIVLGVLYAGYRAFPVTRRPGRYLAAFAVTGMLSLMLGAVQLLPTLEWIGLIPRSLAERWPPAPGVKIIAFISRDLFHNPNVDGVFIPEGAAYLGVFTLAALPFAWLRRPRRDVMFFAVMAFLCIELVYGWQPVFGLAQRVPVLAGLPNWRFLAGADFALTILAGFAISALQSRCSEGNLRSRPAAFAVGLGVSGAACALLLLRVGGHTAIPYGLNLLLFLLALSVAVLASARIIDRSDFLRWTAVLVSADLLTCSFGSTPFVRSADIYPRNPVFDFLNQQANSTWRVAPVDTAYGNNFEVPYGLFTAAGYDFPTKRVSRFLSVFSIDPMVISFNADRIATAPKGALDLTGTRFFVASTWNSGAARLAAFPGRFRRVFESGRSQVFENPDAIPLAFFLPNPAIRVVENDEAQLKAILARDFDPRRAVIIPRAVNAFFGKAGSALAPAIGSVNQTVNEISIGVTVDQKGLLVLNETYYPGWTVEVDEMSAPVIRANYAFMAVPVNPGCHTIRVRFSPASVRVGGALSGIAFLLIAGSALFRFRADRSRGSSTATPLRAESDRRRLLD